MIHPQCADYFDDMHVYRAFCDAAATANTGVAAILICREIDKFMHEALPKSLPLALAWVAMGHQGEVRIHAGVPAPKPLYAVAGIKVLDIVAMAGRADKGACAAAYTRLI